MERGGARKLVVATLANVGVAINFASIEVAVLLMRHGERLETSWLMSLLDSLVFIGCIVGMVIFGYAGDAIGRLVGLRVTMLVAIAGILASLAPLESPTQLELTLCFSRFVVGVGCGGVYPLSAALAYESESTPKLAELSVAVANFGQPLGSVLLYACALVLYSTPASSAAIWRITLVFGALPFVAAIALTFGLAPDDHHQATLTESLTSYLAARRGLRFALVGAGLAWFGYNSYSYGIITFYPQLSAAILGDNTLTILASDLAGSVSAVVVAAVSLYDVKRNGARASVVTGAAAGSAFCVGLYVVAVTGADGSRAVLLWLFVLLRGLVQWPSVGIFALPNTIFSRAVRSRTHGIAAAIGKLGAIFGSATYPLILDSAGFAVVVVVTAFASAATAFACVALVPNDPSAVLLDKSSSSSSKATGPFTAAQRCLATTSQQQQQQQQKGPANSVVSASPSSSITHPYSELDPLIQAAHDLEEDAPSAGAFSDHGSP
ncbi:hypothetical protein CTAYLR_000857 [Chrysophaeum taylorii]|uniref:Major facilitator superfamily (MFS) profile domain-containing protein n=1 Tax=Chrysophaeum taylorii TaxID=2483200 RepID=A0AAD7XS89_9STRA|nr:hypothetical protein CTAYLR_000857 [Chrysophaeum taylorii]